jgi:competence protein ComFC
VRAAATGRLLLELIFPGRCLLCGCWLLLESDRAVPVCNTCKAALIPIHGAACARCGMPLVAERDVCLRCRQSDYAFESSTALFPYAGAARELLGKLKFEGRSRVAGFFAPLVARKLQGECQGWPVVPVPPRPGRKRPDAVELVARRLDRDGGVTVSRLLMRTGGAQQKSLDFAQRRVNIKNRIHMSPSAARLGVPERVVLLDDVFTTGATLDACARVLIDAGCARVHCVTLSIEQ